MKSFFAGFFSSKAAPNLVNCSLENNAIVLRTRDLNSFNYAATSLENYCTNLKRDNLMAGLSLPLPFTVKVDRSQKSIVLTGDIEKAINELIVRKLLTTTNANTLLKAIKSDVSYSERNGNIYKKEVGSNNSEPASPKF